MMLMAYSGAVGGGEADTMVEVARQLVVGHEDRKADLVDVEHLGCERVAAAVSLAGPRVEMHSHRDIVHALRRRGKICLIGSLQPASFVSRGGRRTGR